MMFRYVFCQISINRCKHAFAVRNTQQLLVTAAPKKALTTPRKNIVLQFLSQITVQFKKVICLIFRR